MFLCVSFTCFYVFTCLCCICLFLHVCFCICLFLHVCVAFVCVYMFLCAYMVLHTDVEVSMFSLDNVRYCPHLNVTSVFGFRDPKSNSATIQQLYTITCLRPNKFDLQ